MLSVLLWSVVIIVAVVSVPFLASATVTCVADAAMPIMDNSGKISLLVC